MPGDAGKYGHLSNTEFRHVVISMVLAFSQIRSLYIVGKALTEKYPSTVEWELAMNSQDFLELIEEFAVMIQDMRDTIDLAGVMGPEQVANAVEKHYNQAFLSVKDFADLLDIEGEELLSVLINFGKMAH